MLGITCQNNMIKDLIDSDVFKNMVKMLNLNKETIKDIYFMRYCDGLVGNKYLEGYII